MNQLINVLKGMIIGIANVIPGVSGGTMAVSMGIYDRIIGCVSGLFKDFRKNVLFLLPILAGCGIGIIGFTYIIEYLLSRHTYVTCMAFIGLILGGLPLLYAALNEKRRKAAGRGIGVSGAIAFILAFALCAGLPLAKANDTAMTAIPVTAGNMAVLFVLGVVASATMVIPGVSGSMVLMILGYYYGILNTIKGAVEALRAFDVPAMVNGALLLIPFGIGVVLGIFLIAKLISFLFDRFGVQTYCAILGLVIAPPVAIFINTGLVGIIPSLSIWTVILGILFMIAGLAVTNILGEK